MYAFIDENNAIPQTNMYGKSFVSDILEIS